MKSIWLVVAMEIYKIQQARRIRMKLDSRKVIPKLCLKFDGMVKVLPEIICVQTKKYGIRIYNF